MPNLINYQAATQNVFNPYSNQYGVNIGSGLSSLSGLASMVPVVGPMLGAGLNLVGQMMQNRQQEKFFEEYMSPQARMSQMRAAGINPNAAAQGISGASAPQMNAAAPSGVFSSLGESLGQSVNTALTASNIAAQTKNLEVQTEGQDLQNKITEVELGMKPDLLNAELDDLKESANEKRQAIEQSKAEVKKIDEEVENLKKEREYLIAQIGLVEYEQKLKDAETRAANAKAALDNAERELTEVNKDIQVKERENYLTPEERINKQAEATVKSMVENTPTGQLAKRYKEDLDKDLEQLDKTINELASKKGYNHWRVRQLREQRNRRIRVYRNKIRRINKGASAGIQVAGNGINVGG